MTAMIPRMQHFTSLFTDPNSNQSNPLTQTISEYSNQCDAVSQSNTQNSNQSDSTTQNNCQSNAFTQVLHFLSDEVSRKTSEYNAWASETKQSQGDVDSLDIGQFAGQVEELISSILLAVQKLKKQHMVTETQVEEKEGRKTRITLQVLYHQYS